MILTADYHTHTVFSHGKGKIIDNAIIAKEKGLEGLANIIYLQMTKKSAEEEAKAYLSEEKEVSSVEDSI